jgi:hypothetical protein
LVRTLPCSPRASLSVFLSSNRAASNVAPVRSVQMFTNCPTRPLVCLSPRSPRLQRTLSHWIDSPPYFYAATKTIGNLASARLNWGPPAHRLHADADTPPDPNGPPQCLPIGHPCRSRPRHPNHCPDYSGASASAVHLSLSPMCVRIRISAVSKARASDSVTCSSIPWTKSSGLSTLRILFSYRQEPTSVTKLK